MSQYVKKIRTEAGDLQIDYNALANLPTISNPNLLINGDFQVWQRGASFSNHSNAYCADRWHIRNSNASTHLIEKSSDVPENGCMTNSIHIVEQKDRNTYLQYHFENALRGTYTLSFWYKSTASFYSYIIDNGNWIHIGTNQASSGWTRVEYTFTASALQRINLIHELSVCECYITGVKLEIGSNATAFMPRLYGEEFALCQRFYQYYDTIDVAANGTYVGTRYFSGFVFPTKMRVAPTLTAHYENSGNAIDGVNHHVYDYGIGDFHHSDTTLGGLAVKYLQLDAEIY